MHLQIVIGDIREVRYDRSGKEVKEGPLWRSEIKL